MDNKSSGIGITGALTLIFVVLKLTGAGAVANWSWIWVFSPIWIVLSLNLLGLLLWIITGRK